MSITIDKEKQNRIANKVIKEFQTAVLSWYKKNGRHLPWRGTNDPYKIMVAEFLLQKTDVKKVQVVYKEFIFRWPTAQLLFKEEVSSISKIILPLDLRYKATRLKSTANAVVKKFGGKIPETKEKLLELPGVGRYIASAIECFAYNKPKAILDTNIIRIFDRVLGVHSEKNRPRDDVHLWDIAQALVPYRHAREYNWALLDFGALVCKSREPLCRECVLQNMCMFLQHGNLSTKKTYEKDKS